MVQYNELKNAMESKYQIYKLSCYNVFHKIGDRQYMWNTYSGALLGLDKEAQKYVTHFLGSDDGSVEFNTLKTNGFIVHERIDELGRVCFQEKRALYSRSVDEMQFVISLGLGCNYSCWYCFENEHRSTMRMTPEIAIEVAGYIKKQLKNNQTVKRFRLSWFGGEPLLYTDIIEIISKELQAYVHQNNIVYDAMLTTNGRYLDADTLNKLQKLSINKAQITLDGMRESYCKNKGASSEDFDCVVENICNAAGKIELTVRLNIQDADEAIAMSDYLLGQHNLAGKIKFILSFVRDYSMPSNKAKQSFIDYVDTHSKWIDYVYTHFGASSLHIAGFPRRMNTACGFICSDNISIGPQGEFYKCDQSLGNKLMIVGDIWNGRFYNNAEFMHYSTVDKYSDCSQCAYLPICMGGCVMHRIKKYGGFDCEALKRWRLKQKFLQGGMLI